MAPSAHVSRANGKLGGRPKGPATIEREKAKAYIAENIAKHMPAIFNVLLKKALTGDVPAVKELLDRGFGKSIESMDINMQAVVLTPIYNALSKKIDVQRHDSDT